MRKWSDLVDAINRTKSFLNFTSLHVYNQDLKIGDLLQLVYNEILAVASYSGMNVEDKQSYMNRSNIVRVVNQLHKPIIISNNVNENWGFLSSGK